MHDEEFSLGFADLFSSGLASRMIDSHISIECESNKKLIKPSELENEFLCERERRQQPGLS